MKTPYVTMSIQHQTELLALYHLVRLAGNYSLRDGLAPVSHSLMDAKQVFPGAHEIILENRFTLNPCLVNFSLVPIDKCEYTSPMELLQPKYLQYGRESHRNPEVRGRNYREGVHNLFTELKENIVFIWKPPVRQYTTNILLTPTFHAYQWFESRQEFLLLVENHYADKKILRTGPGWTMRDIMATT